VRFEKSCLEDENSLASHCVFRKSKLKDVMKVFELDSGPEALEQEVPVLQVGSPKTVTAGTDHLKEVVVFKAYQNMLSTSFCVCSNGSV
jgi:hypothetical protein